VVLYQRGCDYNDAASCWRLGGLHENGRHGLTKDDASAAAFYERACDGSGIGVSLGCSEFVRLYASGRGGLTKDDVAALYRRACGRNSVGPCAELKRVLSQ
jgi:TPR repeat protein